MYSSQLELLGWFEPHFRKIYRIKTLERIASKKIH